MQAWSAAVDVLREAMFAYAQVTNGNLAYGIMAVTLLARLALFPLTLRLARAAAVQQAAMRRVAPELDRIRARFKGDPSRIAEATKQVLEREGVSMLPMSSCVGALMQMPVLLALFDAVRQCAAAGGRFLWIRDIAKPDVPLSFLVAAITGASMLVGPQPDAGSPQRMLMVALPVVFTVVALWNMAAGVGLYWGVSSTVGIAQGLVVRRGLKT